MSKRILYAEDQLSLRIPVPKKLRRAGYQVTEAENGTRALAILVSGEKFDVLLADNNMPEGMGKASLSGEDLAKTPEAADIPIKIVFTSDRLGMAKTVENKGVYWEVFKNDLVYPTAIDIIEGRYKEGAPSPGAGGGFPTGGGGPGGGLRR